MFVDTNGDVYYCHGCKYEDSDELKFGTIYDDDLGDKIVHNHELFKVGVDDKCKSCVATVCLTCNVAKYINSKKDTFIDKWNDYSNHEIMCKYYQTISKYSIATSNTLEV